MRRDERTYYRIPYPTVEGPRLVTGDRVLQVLDCSERGVRFLAHSHAMPETGERIRGRIRFSRGAEVTVEGVVVRVFGPQVALRLDPPGIPFREILQEQIYLRRLELG